MNEHDLSQYICHLKSGIIVVFCEKPQWNTKVMTHLHNEITKAENGFFFFFSYFNYKLE